MNKRSTIQTWKCMTLAGLMLAASVPHSVFAQPKFLQPINKGSSISRSGGPLISSHTPVRIPGVAPALIGGALINHGGPVQGAPRVYVVFWGWTSDPSGEAPYLVNFLSSVGGTIWLGTVAQYGGGNPVNLYGGSWSDTTTIPAQPTDAQIQAEAAAAINHFGLDGSVNNEIIVATPTGHSVAGFGSSWCGYHGPLVANPNVTYTYLPYMTDAGSACGANAVGGLLDGVSIVEGHELAESITDPLVGMNGAWYDSGGNEIGDKCSWYNLSTLDTSTGSFAIQPLWSNAANDCVSTSLTTLNTGITIGSPLGMAAFNSHLYAAFRANDSSHDLYVTSSTNGLNFASPATHYAGMAMGSTPSAAVFNNRLYLAFQANDSSHTLYVTSSSNGTNFTSPATHYAGIAMGSVPSMAVFNNRLYLAFQANDSSHTLYVTSSSNGTNFTSPATHYAGIAMGSVPSMAVFNNRLYLAFQANDSSHTLYVTSSSNGTNFTSPATHYAGIAMGSVPSMAVFNNRLYLAFQANDSSHTLYVTSSDDGVHFTSPATKYTGVAIGTTPTLSVYNGALYVAFQANDSSHIMYVGQLL